MSYILTPFAKLLLLFYNITGSYGVSIILFGLVVRLVLEYNNFYIYLFFFFTSQNYHYCT